METGRKVNALIGRLVILEEDAERIDKAGKAEHALADQVRCFYVCGLARSIQQVQTGPISRSSGMQKEIGVPSAFNVRVGMG